MRVLLVDVQEPLAAAVRDRLAERHDVTTFDGDPRDRAACSQAASCDVLVHGLGPAADALEALDLASRGTWNLLTTTAASRYVQFSTMRLFEGYDPGWHLDEQFPPLPTPRTRPPRARTWRRWPPARSCEHGTSRGSCCASPTSSSATPRHRPRSGYTWTTP